MSVAPLELWLPALAQIEPMHPLHRVLARADRREDGPRGYLAGLADYFQTTAPLPAAALTRELAAGDASDAVWLSADPAWVEPDLSGARLLACGQLGLSETDAQALAVPLRELFAEAGMPLETTTPDRWHLRLPPGSDVPRFPAPEQALGEPLLQHLPQGTEGRRWRVLLTDVQMLLHQHPLNAQRRAAGLPPINSLWLWGAGALPDSVRSALHGVVGDDALLRALAARAGIEARARTPQALLDAPPGWLFDLQDLPFQLIAADWWPAIEVAVRRRALRLSFASGERWQTAPWQRWRIWRGARA